MPRPRRLVTLSAVAILVAACGTNTASSAPSTAPSTSPSSSSTAGACATAPAPTDMSAWGPPSTTPKLVPVLVTNAVACGQARILMLYLDSKSVPASAPDRTVKAAFYNLARDPKVAVATVNGAFVWTIQDQRGMYVLDVNLPEAGTWGIEFTTEAPNSPAETVRLTFDVRESLPTIQVGQAAPASKTPTAADVGGDLSKVSTDKTPDPAFYQTSMADALAAHKPIMLIFATPKFCTSQQCGPTLDHFKPIAAANPDITFINVEPYMLRYKDGSLQPILDARSQLQATPITDQWGLTSEPWIFAVDRKGIVQGSYEVTITPAELDAILPVISAGG